MGTEVAHWLMHKSEKVVNTNVNLKKEVANRNCMSAYAITAAALGSLLTAAILRCNWKITLWNDQNCRNSRKFLQCSTFTVTFPLRPSRHCNRGSTKRQIRTLTASSYKMQCLLYRVSNKQESRKRKLVFLIEYLNNCTLSNNIT